MTVTIRCGQIQCKRGLLANYIGCSEFPLAGKGEGKIADGHGDGRDAAGARCEQGSARSGGADEIDVAGLVRKAQVERDGGMLLPSLCLAT